MYARANMGQPSREAALVVCTRTGVLKVMRLSRGDLHLRHRLTLRTEIRATPPFNIETPFFLLRCPANLTKTSSAVFSPSVGSKAILLVEAQWEMAT
jgi:hypothetical protein